MADTISNASGLLAANQSDNDLLENRSIKNSAREAGTTGNTFVMNAGLNPLPSFNFYIRIEGAIDLPCKAVHVFQHENEYELIQEGGLNDYVHMRRKPISKPFTFQVERYVGIDYLDPLANGTELILPVFLFVCRYRDGGLPIRVYCFTGCTVTGKQYGELDAEKSGLLLETTTISYRQLYCVNNPAIASAWDVWGEDKKNKGKRLDKNYKETKYAKTIKSFGGTELTESDMVKNAKKWKAPDSEENYNPEQDTTRRAQRSKAKPLTKAEMMKKAKEKKWDIDHPEEIKVPKGPESKGIEQASREEWEKKAKKWDISSPTLKRSAAKLKDRGVTELSKAAMEKSAAKWDIDHPTRTETYAQKPRRKQLTRAEMMAKARKWDEKKKKSGSAKTTVDVLKNKILTKQIADGTIEFEKEAKKWDINNPAENRSAVQAPNTKAETKKWDIADPEANHSAWTTEEEIGAKEIVIKPLAAKKWDIASPDANKSAEGPEAKGIEQLSKKDLEQKAKKWDIASPDANKSAESPETKGVEQPSGKDMEQKAKKWNIASPGANKSAKGPEAKGVAQPSRTELEKKARKWDAKNPNGGKRSAVQPKEQLPIKQMQSKAKKWDANNPDSSKKYAAHPKNEPSMREMQSKARTWPQKKSAANVADFLSKK